MPILSVQNITDGREILRNEETHMLEIISNHFDQPGITMISADSLEKIVVWDLSSDMPVPREIYNNRDNAPVEVLLSANADLAFSLHENNQGEIVVWSGEEYKNSQDLRLSDHRINSLYINDTYNLLVVGDESGVVRVYGVKLT
jgi:hypothetical protein